MLAIDIERAHADETLQQQLFRQIRDRVLSATFPPGMALPSSRELARDLNLSRNTVVLAYDYLITEGYIETRPGVGTFVTTRLPDSCIGVKAAPATGRASDAEEEIVRPRIVFQGERHRVVEKGPDRPPFDFWYGSPNWRHFPLSDWRQLIIDNLSRTSPNLSQYCNPAGIQELRLSIAEHLGAARGIRCTPEQIIITAGAQEGMNLICRLLIEPGVRVVIESPGYGGAARTFESYGAALVPVEVDDRGLLIDRLEREQAALAYVTPSHQFPSGVTLALERRLRMLKWATTVGAYIVEDDYDSDFRYDGPPLTALAGLDRNGCVIYLGTFSKSVGAGLRMGFLVVPEHLIERIVTIKSLASYGHPWLDQIVMAEFIQSGAYNQHLRAIRRIYQRARDTLLGSIERHFGPQHTSGKFAGMHLMWTLTPNLAPAQEFAARALVRGVGIYPLDAVGAIDFGGTRQPNSIVLGYSALTDEQIEEGVARLSQVASAWRS